MADYSKSLLELKTRPQVAVPHSTYAAVPLPTLCVVYHPHASMLGARCVISPDQALAFGRELEFTDVQGNSCFPLLDPFISRELGAFTYRADQVVLSRRVGASGIEYQDRSLTSETRFDLIEGHWHILNCSNRLVLSLGLDAQIQDDLAAMPSIVGRNSNVVAMRRAIRRAAATEDDVLITGPTGVGKEGVANELHRFSQRRAGPLVAVNMAALPTELAVSELFGAEKGAFTGANSAKSGYFREAAGGTLFMDEIGDASPELQAQLLRALQTREVQVLGGPTREVDLRVVAATEQSTQGDQASLRPALFHRLAQQHIKVPPLRERLDDIGLLAEHYFADKRRGPWSSELNDTGVASWCRVFVALTQYAWPGNVRELFAVLGQIDLDTDYPAVPDLAPPDRVEAAPAIPALSGDISDDVFLQALEACDYEAARLAQTLPISRTSIYRRREKLGVPKASDYSAQEVAQALSAHGGDVGAAARALRVSKAALLRLYPEYSV